MIYMSVTACDCQDLPRFRLSLRELEMLGIAWDILGSAHQMVDEIQALVWCFDVIVFGSVRVWIPRGGRPCTGKGCDGVNLEAV